MPVWLQSERRKPDDPTPRRGTQLGKLPTVAEKNRIPRAAGDAAVTGAGEPRLGFVEVVRSWSLVRLQTVAARIPLSGLVPVRDLIEEIEDAPDLGPPQCEAGKVNHLFLQLRAKCLGEFWFCIR
jgi:hypothetical protein